MEIVIIKDLRVKDHCLSLLRSLCTIPFIKMSITTYPVQRSYIRSCQFGCRFPKSSLKIISSAVSGANSPSQPVTIYFVIARERRGFKNKISFVKARLPWKLHESISILVQLRSGQKTMSVQFWRWEEGIHWLTMSGTKLSTLLVS